MYVFQVQISNILDYSDKSESHPIDEKNLKNDSWNSFIPASLNAMLDGPVAC